MLEVLDKKVSLPVFQSASRPVKIDFSREHLVFSKNNVGKLVKDGFPFPWE